MGNRAPRLEKHTRGQFDDAAGATEEASVMSFASQQAK